MTAAAPALLASTARHLRSADPLVTFPTAGGGSWEVWDRFIAIRGERVFEIGNICETCEFWFRRLEAKAAPVDMDKIRGRLTAGLDRLDADVVEAFASVLESGTYRIALFRLQPRRVEPGSGDDYFANDQPAEWPDRDEGPQDPGISPGISYYSVEGRFGVAAPSGDDRVYEFVVPLQPAGELDAGRIAFFERKLLDGQTVTAVAAAVLDVKGHWNSAHYHWCLGHYLLDGHHKVEAAARARRPITLLSFMASERGISSPDHIDRLLADYGRGEAPQG